MIPAVGEDPRGVDLPRRGTPLGGLPRPDLPRHRPPIFASCIANTVCPGARAGESLLGADVFFRYADGRESIAVRRKNSFGHLHPPATVPAPPGKPSRKGRALDGLPLRSLPRRRPPIFAYCIANTIRPGPAPGNLFWVRQSFYCLRIGADGRETPADRESFDVCFAGGHEQWPSGGKIPIAGQNGMLAELLPAAFAIRGAGIGDAG